MLSTHDLQALRYAGFVVIPGPIASDRMTQFADPYDSAVACADSEDISVGSSTTRVQDFVNRGAEFDSLYVYEPILEFCCCVIGQSFKLSTMHGRTVRPYSPAQNLHVDFKRDENGWPMLGYISMVDEFRKANGATRFIPRSHQWSLPPANFPRDTTEDFEDQVVAW